MEHANERSPDIALYPEEHMRYYSEHGWDVLAYWIVRPLIDLTRIQFRVTDTANVYRPANAGERTFVFSNHLSWADHFLIYYFLMQDYPHRPTAITKEKYYSWPLAREVLRWQNCIPITNIKITFARWYQEQHGRAPNEADFVAFMEAHGADLDHAVNRRKAHAMAQTAVDTEAMLKRGRIVLGYPEGTRSKTGRMQPTKTGIMQLPLMLRGTIVPTAVWGTEKVLGQRNGAFDFIKYFFWKGPEIHCRFGAPLRWDEALAHVEAKWEQREDPVGLARVRQLRDEIVTGAMVPFSPEATRYERVFDEVALLTMRRISDLLPEAYRAADAVEVKYSRSV